MSQLSANDLPSEDRKQSNAEDENETIPEISQQNILKSFKSDPVFESPIDINISKVIPLNNISTLAWMNFDIPPKKMKITNTGHTVILSGKWGQERPYITNGLLLGKYVFSQMHVHWGANDMEGSEHTIDGRQYPGEIHLVTFKSSYLTQESALKETDGVVIFVYILTLQNSPNPSFKLISDAVPGITNVHTSIKIDPIELEALVQKFESDYFLYRGSVSTTNCTHPITWLLTRIPIGVSADQMDSFRFLLDYNGDLIKRNFRPVKPIEDRKVYHALPSPSKYSTLLPYIDVVGITQVYSLQVCYNKINILKLAHMIQHKEHYKSERSNKNVAI